MDVCDVTFQHGEELHIREVCLLWGGEAYVVPPCHDG